jgi:hypothetical protein
VTARARRLLVGGVILWVLAVAAYGTLRLTYGERPAYVHVRWAATVDAAARERIERTHSLTRGALREGRTWGYSLTDLSSQNIREIVGNPAVEDTHNIHRTAFRIWRTAPRDAYLSARPAWIAAILEFLVPACLVAGALALGVGLLQVKGQRSKVRGERSQAKGSSHV